MPKYRCFNIYRLSVSFEKEYVTDDPYKYDPDNPLVKREFKKLEEGIVKIVEYLKPPIAKFLCIEESLYKKLYKETKEELKKIYYNMSTIPRSLIIDNMIHKILEGEKRKIRRGG